MKAMNTPAPAEAGARPEVRDAAISTLVAAFADDAAVRTIYPCDLDYRRHFPGFLAALGGRAFDAGTVDLDPVGRGAALWVPPNIAPDDAAIMAHLEATVPPERLAVLAPGMEAQGHLHPTTPHWYLPWIGVRPEARGAGVGSALLERGLARVDADGMPAYLEATSERNAALYLRHGFEVLSIMATPGYPELIAMWRPARPGRRSPAVVEAPTPEPDRVPRPGLLARLVEGVRDYRQRVRTYRALRELDDRLLDDIGLSYDDIAGALFARQRARRALPSGYR